jgi:two-component system nitrogen regulation sensor histidine kinase NtrY
VSIFQSFAFRLLSRLLLVNILGILLYHLAKNTQLYFTISGTAILFILAIISLFVYINQTKEDIKRFIQAVKLQDSTVSFNSQRAKGSFPELYESFNDIIKMHKNIQLERDSMFLLIKTILEQIPVGVIVIKGKDLDVQQSEIVMFNLAASRLLQAPTYKYWHRLQKHNHLFTKVISEIQDGGKRFIELKIQDKLIQLSTEVFPLNLYQNDYVIISFQNIKDEIEQKEAEAWNRLIGVISHEILNSITPISSLSDTVNSMVSGKNSLNAEDLEDLKPAIMAIKRRSLGLLDFVKDYRLIAELPTPVLEYHTISELLQHIQVLMQPLAVEKNVMLKIAQTASKMSIRLDIKLIEQALINLVTNSIYAVEGLKNPVVEISYRLEDTKLYLEVIDNGRGVEPEIMEKIFIPFFTTRKNGSGIGLTITRNIMKMHQGSLEVTSIPFENTTFSLVFKYQ